MCVTFFSSRPTMHSHVKTILKRIRQTYLSLRQLKQIGFNQTELTTVYKSAIRPFADFCDIVYHSLLTDEHDEQLERTYVGAQRAFFDYKLSRRNWRKEAGVTPLRDRIVKHCDRYANKCLNSKFKSWFPKKNRLPELEIKTHI